MSSARPSVATLYIATPEGILFSLPLAGPVIRAVATFVDLAVLMALSQVVVSGLNGLQAFSSDVGGAGQILAGFALSIGYGIFCELLFNGQTMGKKVLGIRVMDERGLRLRPSQVIVRNLLRAFDMLTLFYAVGGLFALFTARSQRLGDLAAGTVVIREIRIRPPEVEGLLDGKYNSLRGYPHLEARLRQKVSAEEAQHAFSALLRRPEMETAAAVRLFAQMAERFRSLVKFPEEVSIGLSDEQYVRNVVESLYRRSGTGYDPAPRLRK